MAITLTANGVIWPNGVHQTSTPFMYQHVNATSWAITTSFVQAITSPDWQTPARASGNLYLYLPQRNDGGTWGGGYTRLFYRINSGGWVNMGHSGYSQCDSVMSASGAGRIDCQTSIFNFDFSSITSNFTVAFRIDTLRHDGEGSMNGSCDITTGGNSTYTFNYAANGTRTPTGGAYSAAHMVWLGVGYGA
jgi:hypothetical protein